MPTKKVESVGEFLDNARVGKEHYKLLGLIGSSEFFDGFDIYIAGSVLAAMVAIGFSSITKNAMFISATFIGLLIGTLVGGWISDLYGRKKAFNYSLLIYGLFTLLSATVVNFSQLYILRLIAGFGMGAIITLSYGLWVEFVPKKTRGFWGSMLALITNLSQPLAFVAALLIIPIYGWRAMFLLTGGGALIVWLITLKYLPESPRWLELHGQREKAYDIVHRFVKSIPSRVNYISSRSKVASSALSTKKVSLLSPGVLKALTLATIISICTLIPWYTFTAWMPTFFIKEGFSMVKTLTFSLIIMSGSIPGAIIAALIIDKLGRKYTLIGLIVLLAVVSLLYGYATKPWELLTYGFTYIMVGNIIIAMTIANYIPELLPTEVRMRGSGIANAFGRAGTIFSPFLIAFLFVHYAASGVFISSFIIYIIMAIAILILGTETKRKSLEDIKKEEISAKK
jgi:putative MFS transporter